MDTIIQDFRFAFRSLRSQRSITAIAIACLALGIGANTAIFSVVRAVLLESLPFRDPSNLVRLYESGNFGGTKGLGSVSIPTFIDWRAQNQSFESMAAYSPGSFDLAGNGEPERIRGTRASANLFGVLGAKPELGRTFALDDDQPGHAPVVVLSDGFWRRRFGASRSVIGSTLSIDNTGIDSRTYTVVGVMPPEFDFPIGALRTDVWVPLPFRGNQATQRGNHWLSVVARLKPGVDSTAAMGQMATITKRLTELYPDPMRDRGVAIVGMNRVVVGRVRTPLLMLLGAVGLVLLIACANVANLLLARASGRRREVAVRTALGAERGRLIRQFLTESLLLSSAGGALGIAVAYWGLRGLLAYAAATLPRADAVGLNTGVLLFAAVVSVVTGIAFGLVPALRATQADLRQDLNDAAGRTGTGRAHHRTLDALIVAEIALSLVLLVGAGLLVRGFTMLIETDPGLKADHVLTFHVAAPSSGLPDTARYTQFYGAVLERIRALPGVRVGASTTLLPIQGSGWNGNFTIVGRPEEKDPARAPFAEYRVISGDYFRALGIPMTKGREFTDQDSRTAPPVVIVNDEFVRRYFPNEDPIGKQILPWTDKPATIVGVARSVRQIGLDQAPASELYVVAAQTPGNLGEVTYILSTRMQPEAVVSSVRSAIRTFAPEQPVFLVKSMDAVISDSLKTRKLMLSLLAVFAALAVILSAAGVYGVMSYGVSQRRREIGIRMALGARGSDVTSMVLVGAAKLTTIGVVIGLSAAAALSRVLKDMVYSVGVRDPITFASVAVLIVLVSLLASLVPALRASRVDPLTAIRTE